MSQALEVVAFDGDDTLWHNESVFNVTQDQFRALMAGYVAGEHVDERLFATEMANLRRYGYGVKSFTLSMIETAIDLSEGRVSTAEIGEILRLGHGMLEHPVDVFPGVAEAIEAVAADVDRVLLVTKGDLFHQESKLARSGLGERFADVEVVAEKDVATYRRILARHRVEPGAFVMVGDSMRSDVLQVLEIGAAAVHVPGEFIWVHEVVADDDSILKHPRFRRIESLAALGDALRSLAG